MRFYPCELGARCSKLPTRRYRQLHVPHKKKTYARAQFILTRLAHTLSLSSMVTNQNATLNNNYVWHQIIKIVPKLFQSVCFLPKAFGTEACFHKSRRLFERMINELIMFSKVYELDTHINRRRLKTLG